MKTAGLSLDQAPPLSIPASFFLSIPAGILLAGCILLATGTAAFISPWMPQALALAHAGTLGVLAMGMAGALYQMTPVVAGTPVPCARLAHLVHALMLVGLATFIWRLLGGPTVAVWIAIACFSIGLAAFLLPLGWALARCATRNDTVQGMRLSVASLAVISLAGVVMARGYADGVFPQDRMLWVQFHLTVALLGWVGGLIISVSWQVVPMFYLAASVSQSITRWFFRLLLLGLVLPLVFVVTFADTNEALTPGRLMAIGALPAALVVWYLHPALILRNILRRKRKRSDASLLFWKAGLGTAFTLIPVSTAAILLPDPRWQILFGWLAIWGWAAMIMHGMLSRIVPFLVWFHRYSPRLGYEPVPSMRSLLSQRRIKTGFWLHFASVLVGVTAIFAQMQLLAQLTGLLLVAVGVSLANMLIHVLRSR